MKRMFLVVSCGIFFQLSCMQEKSKEISGDISNPFAISMIPLYNFQDNFKDAEQSSPALILFNNRLEHIKNDKKEQWEIIQLFEALNPLNLDEPYASANTIFTVEDKENSVALTFGSCVFCRELCVIMSEFLVINLGFQGVKFPFYIKDNALVFKEKTEIFDPIKSLIKFLHEHRNEESYVESEVGRGLKKVVISYQFEEEKTLPKRDVNVLCDLLQKFSMNSKL
ncbi:MAG TPA: hypothetical protein VL201_00595 [Patescibacteria group bacterium]|jgi:hypothetical protein|nr:hypothetical protein [Patescibacteria group bacterium]